LPVTLLGLAIDRSVRGQGLGEHLLLDALHRSLTHAGQIAAMAVVVDTKTTLRRLLPALRIHRLAGPPAPLVPADGYRERLLG